MYPLDFSNEVFQIVNTTPSRTNLMALSENLLTPCSKQGMIFDLQGVVNLGLLSSLGINMQAGWLTGQPENVKL